jgi:hypothetical protein
MKKTEKESYGSLRISVRKIVLEDVIAGQSPVCKVELEAWEEEPEGLPETLSFQIFE